MLEEGNLCFLKRNLADFLTASRVIIGLIVLSLSFIGKSAYIAVVILALVGAATDILDGKVARHYLDENREGKLGKYDIEIDTLFVLCIVGYLSFSGIVIPKVAGLAWVGLALIAAVLYNRKPKILLLLAAPSVVALLIIAGLYDLKIFTFVIVPALVVGIIMNHKRILYLVFEYWPRVFSK